MPKTKKQTENKKHLAFVKFTYKWLLEQPHALANIENYNIREAYKYFLCDSEIAVMNAVKNYGMQTGCLSADAITKEEYEQAIGVNIESNTKV